MSEATAAVSGQRGWLESLESRPWGPLWLATGISAVIVGAMLVWWAVFGFWHTLFDPAEPLGISFDGRNHLTIAILLGFILTSSRWVQREALRSLHGLEAASTLTPDAFAAEIRRVSTVTPKVRAISLGGALLIGTVIIALTSAEPLRYLAPEAWDAHHVWAIANNVVLFSMMIEGAFSARVGWQALDRISRSLRRIDLLDRQSLQVIGRYGFPSAILWLVGGSISSFLAWGMENVWPMLAILSAILALASFSLVRPMQIVHRRLRETKGLELSRVREKIAEAKEASLVGNASAADQAALLPGLLAYEARIESVREWPFDTPTLVRFAALALIAVGSWLGGAVVERALGAVLG